MAQYVKPYFEAKIKALRMADRSVKKDKAVGINIDTNDTGGLERGSGKGLKGKISRDGKAKASSEYELFRSREQERESKKEKGKAKKKRANLEWRDRWVVIHDGILSLCKDRSVSLCHLLAFFSILIVQFFFG